MLPCTVLNASKSIEICLGSIIQVFYYTLQACSPDLSRMASKCAEKGRGQVVTKKLVFFAQVATIFSLTPFEQYLVCSEIKILMSTDKRDKLSRTLRNAHKSSNI